MLMTSNHEIQTNYNTIFFSKDEFNICYITGTWVCRTVNSQING